VEEEASQELHRGQGDGYLAVVVVAILDVEIDETVMEAAEAFVGDANAVGVAAEVAQDVPWAEQRGFTVDVPFLSGRLTQGLVGGLVVGSEKVAPVQSATKLLEELATKDQAEFADSHEEMVWEGDPTSAGGVQPSSSDDAMNVRVIEQGLGPRVENRREAETGTEIRKGDFLERFADCGEKEVVGELLVAEEELMELVGYREDEVEVLDGQDVSLTGIDPSEFTETAAFGAVTVTAGVVGLGLVVAGVANVEMASQGGSAAVGDGLEGVALLSGEVAEVVGVSANDLGEFYTWTVSASPAARAGTHSFSSPGSRKTAASRAERASWALRPEA